MNYKYRRGQLFGMRLPVPNDILKKVYNNSLSFVEYLRYDLEGKIPISCLLEDDQNIVLKFGIEKAKTLDWELLDSHRYYYKAPLKMVVLEFDKDCDDINSLLWERLKDEIHPGDYSSSMKKRYPERFIDPSSVDSDIRYLCDTFNDGKLSLEDIVENWNLFKDKDLSFCLRNDASNTYSITDKQLKQFMEEYYGLASLLGSHKSIYSFINDVVSIQTEEERKEYLKQLADEVLDESVSEHPRSFTMDEYRELLKHTNLKDFILRHNSYKEYHIDKLMEELDSLPEDYLFQMPFPISLLADSDVLSFIGIYGLKNVVDFDNECGQFFSKNDCEMLKLMNDMYLHYGGNEHDPNKSIYTIKNIDENGNYVDRPYTKDEFYEAMRRMIIYGPSDWNYADKAPDYREMTGEFRTRNSELFLSEDAPEDLQKMFYTKSITPEYLREHRDYLPFLRGKSLDSCFVLQQIQVEGSNSLYGYENLYRFVVDRAGFDEGMDFILEYADVFNTIFQRDNYNVIHYEHPLSIDDSLEDIRNTIDESLRHVLLERRTPYPETIPKSLREHYPTMFLEEDAPEELKKDFYGRMISFDSFGKHPEYRKYLENVDFELILPNPLVPVKGKGIYERCSFVPSMVDTLGREKSFDVLESYGSYLQKVYDINQLRYFEYSSLYSEEEFLDALDQSFVQTIIDGKMKYGEDVPMHFRKSHPTFFLGEDASSDIKNKFYNREFTLKDFLEDSELLNSFSQTNIVCGFPEKYSWMIPLFEEEENVEKANYNRLKVMSAYSKIQDVSLQSAFQEYVMEHGKTLNMEQIDYLSEVLYRLSMSNSSEMFTFRKELAAQILESSNPLESLSKIEDVFIHNNIPTVGKIYSCFEILHPDFRGFQFDGDRVSPALQKSSTFAKKVIVFTDLIKASFGSNNKSVLEYLDNIEQGSSLYQRLLDKKVDFYDLSLDEQKEFMTFYNHLITLYNNTLKGKKENSFQASGDVMKDMEHLRELLSPNGSLDYKLEDRIISMFCGFCGIDTLEDAKKYIRVKVQSADKRNREAAKEEMVLQKGDLVKGIGGIQYLRNILQNGSVSKEYLGSSASSDATPLDTDVSMILSDDGNNVEKMNATAASGYGPIWFVLKNDDRFITTRTKGGLVDQKRDLSKLELFYTGVLNEGHYGIRTGFASSDINYIVMDSYDSRVGLEIAMNGFYIPIANKEGKILFTPEDYDLLRKKMSGLSYYGDTNYEFSPTLINPDVEEFAKEIDKSNLEVQRKRKIINKLIQEALEEDGYHLKNSIDGDLSEGYVELIDTGSTGRGTNKPGDGDFDFMMRLDRSLMSNPERLARFKKALIEKLDKSGTSEMIRSGDFRLKGVAIDEDTTVDIDITFVEKTDKVQYSTDMALQDRLETIQKTDPEKYRYVVANILLAKKVLKEANAYKPDRGDTPQGGLGGVGIENWILQHGGSFEDAARSFVEAAQGKSFEEFQKSYQVWDFGENHLAEKRGHYSHDNFVTGNMSDAGYQRMVVALSEYLKRRELASTFTDTMER